MTNDDESASASAFGRTLVAASQLPLVRIDRASYLRRSLARYCTVQEIELAVTTSPAEAGISSDIISRVADASVKHETAKVTAISAAAGIPGGFAMIGTVPADAAQYLAHMLRISQKLAYIYSWPELFSQDTNEPDDETQNVLTLFVGVMFGVQAANRGLATVATRMAEQVARQLPRQALTQGFIYPIVKKVAATLGVRMTKGIFARGVAKAIPLAGGVLSGGLTLGTFLPMANRLKTHLATLETTKPRPSES